MGDIALALGRDSHWFAESSQNVSSLLSGIPNVALVRSLVQKSHLENLHGSSSSKQVDLHVNKVYLEQKPNEEYYT
ncbi:hypothetical protein ACVWYF_003916 [Hymenobacter sp. UYAg731]